MTIYNQGNEVMLPSVDLLTLLFDSEYCTAKDDAPLHAEADHPDHVITKSHARRLTRNIAHFLRHRFGIGATSSSSAASADRDIVVTVSTGQSALPCLFYGVVAAGAVYSAASHAGTVGDLARQIRDGPGKLLVCSADLVDHAIKAAAEAGLDKERVLVLESYPEIKLYSAVDKSVACDWRAQLGWKKITDPDELRKSVVCILYSSGTTGLPKGVLVSHTNLVSEAGLVSHVSRPYFDEEARAGNPFRRRTLGHLPAAHIAGLAGYFILPFYEGGLVYWMPSFSFDKFLAHCGSLGIDNFFTVPPIFMAIAKHPAVRDQFRLIRQATSGAAPLTGDIQELATQRMGSGYKIRQTWGMSETTGSATYCPLDEDVRMGCLGRLFPNVQLRLVDDDEKDVAAGTPGEALIKGPIVTQGYHNNPEANASSFTSDGWLRTGDVLRMDGDYLYVVDRKKELIKYKGLQVAPAELEGLIATHPLILDAAVIGIQQNDNEVPRAYVVHAPTPPGVKRLTEDDVVEHVRARVADYKRLRGGVRFVEVVPRSPAGKILRKMVREMRKREEQGSKL